MSTQATTHIITAANGLDQITLYIEDYEPGRGKLCVSCYGCAWVAYWGAMSGKSVLGFLRSVDAGYIVNNLIQGRRQFISSRAAEKREETYLERICEAVRQYAISTEAS